MVEFIGEELVGLGVKGAVSTRVGRKNLLEKTQVLENVVVHLRFVENQCMEVKVGR